MKPSRPVRWQSTRLRVVAVLSLLATLAGGTFLWQSASHADAPSVTLQTHAFLPQKGDLQVAVVLSNDQTTPARGTLQVELVGADGQILHAREKAIDQKEGQANYGFTFPVRETGKLKVRVRLGSKSQETRLSDIILAKPHETALTAGKEFYAGAPTALRLAVHGVRSLTDTVPLPGTEVIVRMRDKDEKVTELYKGTTGRDGQALAQFQLPNVPAGQYTLEVVTKSALGEEKLSHSVRVRDDAKILLVTDKPIYQPGQMIHIRALTLRPYDLKPVANRDLLFEVEDSKGNKVFKRTYKTSEFGVAAVDFQLADEVNMGGYQVRAILGEVQAQKTVTVKRYVLPKFKNAVTTDKQFYLPKETIKGSLQADYFFGKPISGGKVEITASTFDVQFRKFAAWNGRTDENGHVKFEIKLPDYFVGQPLQKGDALVKLDVKVTDTADHSETITKSYPVSDQPIRVSLIAEGGKLVPEMENRVFVAAIYPDGSPAECEVGLWLGQKAQGKPTAKVKTNNVGLAEFRFTPKAKDFRQGNFGQRKIEMLGGQQFGWGPEILLDLFAEARDAKGAVAEVRTTLNAHPLGENVLLRLDKAIYEPGDSMKVDIRTSAGLPTVYLDIVRGGQVMLSKWLDVTNGQAEHRLDLPAEVFGSLEVHAYQMLSSGEIIRDSRVCYVQPRNDLRIKVEPNKSVHEPGENGRIRFFVTDRNGNPTAAALGVIIVDEAVYALQELQPGLEKVYFTLQKELLEPQVQAKFQPADNLPVLIRQPQLPPARQQVAEALLTAVNVNPPPAWNVAPVLERKNQVRQQLHQIGWALWNTAWQNWQDVKVIEVNKKTKKVEFAANALEQLVKKRMLHENMLKGPFGEKLHLSDLAKIEKNFTAENLASAITLHRLHNLSWWTIHEANQQKDKYFKNGKWVITQELLDAAAKRHGGNNQIWLNDAWGQRFRVVQRTAEGKHPSGQPHFERLEIVSVGPDGKLGTKDDIRWESANQYWAWNGTWFLAEQERTDRRLGAFNRDRFLLREQQRGMAEGGFGGDAKAALPGAAPPAALPQTDLAAKGGATSAGPQGGASPPRIREYFPETMLWQPALITDEKGVADLAVSFADSITTWRLTASANSRGGALGGVTAPLKVFQDFFVDIDLPVNFTQQDEVAFPVAVYNYLTTPQTVKIELKKGDWFELLEGGYERKLDLKPNEVTSIKFRIRAHRIGNHPLTVMAYGSKKSDAVRRVIEVAPNGERKETVISDRLAGNITQTIEIPQDAIPDSYKTLVRIYPGVMAQVLEGTEGMLRLPGG